MEYTDYDTRLAAYAVILDDRQRVLLALWNEGPVPRWTLPGGGVELDESAEDGAVREVREETGYDVALTGLIGVHSYVIAPERRLLETDRAMKAVRVVYTAAITGGELTREIDGTTDEARWWALGEVAELARVGLVDLSLEMWRAAR